MLLVRKIGWFSSALGRPVYYSIPLFTTVQDYMKRKPVVPDLSTSQQSCLL
uniref:Uncharacterized protein n=1 Tax=Utricularia reniformis TaxID=192314 RepID=A0A1Y0AZT3_9LAMI|nr:hypothetical protein AEK19_MT0366 [Utricularia reniformis]ART30638.1 hypothetical protein AEK19_MT0366 [Utricularia reniformis]